ncbi:hypothetical protein R2103_05540 [Nitrosomonas sp. Is24]|uniref:hypothetical protein n=1 Tax=Nitrosomonas sp. Is24 TaxID=3080533 RepID=UPI00294AEF8A|nr:hypothetical protein [Nitrosomonas sp. Is24]MDV6341229.1 hypothetical protein [Nitrosomonas sp. Is24]
MADKDSTAANNATPEQLAEQYPYNENPFGVWYCADADQYKWAVNDENGDGFTNTTPYETALILSEALKIRYKNIKNGLPLNAEQQREITDTKKTIEIDTDSYDQASILLTRAHGMLDLIFTLENSGGDSTGGLCRGSLSAAVDAAMTSIAEAEELLFSGN